MPKLNEEKIAEELNMDELETEVSEIKGNLNINNIKKNPDQILSENIDRANRILDVLESDAINKQTISARKAEVMAALINSVTNAANSIIQDDYNQEYLQIRKDVIRLKEKELHIKELGSSQVGSQQLIVTDRETILKALKEDKGKIPNVKQLTTNEKE